MLRITWHVRGTHVLRAQRKPLPARLCRRWPARLLACAATLASLTHAPAGPVCRPKLALTQVQFSPVQPNMERRWSAVVTVDASSCASTAGHFQVGFLREKENAVELEFREELIWSAPAVTIGIEVWADEAVQAYWIDSIQACPCAR